MFKLLSTTAVVAMLGTASMAFTFDVDENGNPAAISETVEIPVADLPQEVKDVRQDTLNAYYLLKSTKDNADPAKNPNHDPNFDYQSMIDEAQTAFDAQNQIWQETLDAHNIDKTPGSPYTQTTIIGLSTDEERTTGDANTLKEAKTYTDKTVNDLGLDSTPNRDESAHARISDAQNRITQIQADINEIYDNNSGEWHPDIAPLVAERDALIESIRIANEAASTASTNTGNISTNTQKIDKEIQDRINALNALESQLTSAIAAAEASAKSYAKKLDELQQIQIDSNTSRVQTLEDQWNTDPLLGATKVTDKKGNVIKHINYNDNTVEDKIARVENIETIADRVMDNTARIQALESITFKPAAKESLANKLKAEFNLKLLQANGEAAYVNTTAGLVDLRGWNGSINVTGVGIQIALDKTMAYDVLGLSSTWVLLK